MFARLKITLALFALAATLFASQALAGTGVFGTYLFINDDGTAAIYGLTETSASAVTDGDFQGIDLGVFDSSTMTLTLNGAQANTFKSGTGNVTGAELSYRIYDSGVPTGSFSQISLGFGANASDGAYLDAGGVTVSGGGDQKWETTAHGVDLLDGLAPGTYDLDVFVKAFTNEGDRFHSNGGNNYIGSFTVAAVPEVSAALALPLLLGSVWGFRSLKRRRTCC